MPQIQPDDYVVIRRSNEVGRVTEVFTDPVAYRVQASGEVREYYLDDVVQLTPIQIHILNTALKSVAEVIDMYHDDDVYDPRYSEEGEIIFSSAAAAVLRTLAFPTLILEMADAGERIAVLDQKIEELERQINGQP